MVNILDFVDLDKFLKKLSSLKKKKKPTQPYYCKWKAARVHPKYVPIKLYSQTQGTILRVLPSIGLKLVHYTCDPLYVTITRPKTRWFLVHCQIPSPSQHTA